MINRITMKTNSRDLEEAGTLTIETRMGKNTTSSTEVKETLSMTSSKNNKKHSEININKVVGVKGTHHLVALILMISLETNKIRMLKLANNRKSSGKTIDFTKHLLNNGNKIKISSMIR